MTLCKNNNLHKYENNKHLFIKFPFFFSKLNFLYPPHRKPDCITTIIYNFMIF